MQKKIQPFGTWPSSFDAATIVAGQNRLSQVQIERQRIYWIETRPAEQGRATIVCCDQRTITELLPPPYSARSRVHEYGGASYTVNRSSLYFVNDKDQQVWQRDPSGHIRQITAAPAFRFGELVVPAVENPAYLLAVGEHHTPALDEPANSLVKIDCATGEITVLHQGQDFYAYPCLDRQATNLCWISWNHPDMPWDRTRLWTARIDPQGSLSDIVCQRSEDEAVFQPQWSPAGELYFISDKTGWWNLYRLSAANTPLLAMHAEFAKPLWNLGLSTYAFVSDAQIVCTYIESGESRLGLIDTRTGGLQALPVRHSSYDAIRAVQGGACYIASSPTAYDALYRFDLRQQRETAIMHATDTQPAAGTVSTGTSISFPTGNGETAYGFYYAPTHPDYRGPAQDLPPLIVISHGGPTSCSTNGLSVKVQYWTSRGFAVLDVNYRGSTGYGRAYRNRLYANWGILDVEDCVNGARFLVAQKLADPQRLIIRGSSAGGYTTLAALTFFDLFKAGASYYGIGDLCALARDTHKFEAHYLDKLVGRWPDEQRLYRQRSPINHVEQLSCPIIFFQGLKDKVVPPEQAQQMVEALKHKGLPVAYQAYADEAHGFRQADTLVHSLQAELYFYDRIFSLGGTPQAALQIDNLDDTTGQDQ